MLKLCEQSEVKRVVFASTNHVTHGHFIGNEGPGSIEDNGEKPRVDLRSKTLPDSFYAVSKVFGEELCKYYALVKRKFSAVCLRVGWCLVSVQRDYDKCRLANDVGCSMTILRC